MIRTINDFLNAWKEESASTLKIFGNLTDESLQVAIPGGRTLGRLANHLVETLTEMPSKLGLPIEEEFINHTTVENLIANYKKHSDALVGAIVSNWEDSKLEEETNLYGDSWKNGLSLSILMAHQTHHRGQMTVVMRMAGLKVPGVYGPSKEEWVSWGKEALA